MQFSITALDHAQPRWRWRLCAALLACFAAATCAQAREMRVGVHQEEPKIFLGADRPPTGILDDLFRRPAPL